LSAFQKKNSENVIFESVIDKTYQLDATIMIYYHK